MTGLVADAAADPATTDPAVAELVCTGWSALSGLGVGRAECTAGVLAGRSGLAGLDTAGPFTEAALVPGFSAAEALGRKGTRSMDRVTALAVSTVGQLLADCGPSVTADPSRLGLVLGTGSGSVQSIMDFTRDSLTGDKPFHVDPARFPNTVMNKAAGQSAIWHGIKGPNTTIAGGWLTGLLALSYAVRIYRAGRCDRVLCGAAEEYSEQRAWLEWHTGTRTPLGEGGAVFLLESAESAAAAGRTAVARVLGTRFGAYGDAADAGPALASCVRGALVSAGVAARDVAVVAPLGADEEAALDLPAARFVHGRSLFGDTSAAATGLHMAAALAVLERSPSGSLALVTGIDRDGTVGCALLGRP
ncbi:MAG TPA: beta-ketoacyl synthase N-terminal-like domain-containing protein [Pseudonocardiaceae bacterium]|jgi:3-oxoacyl-[acyl-carrier-protein] synthase II|nr:beta-ketoacyl synthase N-terminal-like domain-containing protein [Pseudonocardiaceae bacterium]